MKEYTYRDRIRQDLANLNYYRFAIVHGQKELEAVEAEFTAIKATNYDKMPSGSGENPQEEKLINAIARKEELEANIALNKIRVANLERLLDQLPEDERLVIERKP